MNRSILLSFACLLVLVLSSGCAHYQVNEQSREFDQESGYRFDALESGPDNTDSLFVCLMFSGGGTRAAALSYGVMQALHETRIVVDGREKSLLDEVDCISSVSGGSFTAAYYGLFREDLFQDFRPQFLERNIQANLAAGLFNPVNWFRLASPYFSRIDMAAELYNREIFKDARFSSLKDNGRPLIILNATNLGSERRFEFTQEYFDAMGSRLDSYPVSRAVAASSAFPYLLTPISLKNYPVAANYTEPWWYQGALDPENWTSSRYNAARNLGVYLDEDNKYVHLMDGGLSDNVGARAVLDAYDRGFIRTRINQGRIDQLVLIVVNARTKGEDTLSTRPKPPGLFTVAAKTATVAMDNYSHESVASLREELYARVQTQKDEQACIDLLAEHCPDAPRPFALAAEVDPYVIEINFEAADLLPDEDPRYYLDLPTSFKLSTQQVEKLVNIGPRLLQASPQFQCLLKVLEAESQGLDRPEECPMGAGIFP
ncbi:patatin-like phospholipase family protein [Desulfonatronovibrio hydrogenovorans]|uniref:patatin-like phospholipase family protein n=1 Tax=Desulfonatronovibrio hydrogenovorans TaxID=53245 RepID=UPI00054EBB9C|nr:patatin-like phospholipase family protein [Desulfonatronovibrio hydrogenovorans]